MNNKNKMNLKTKIVCLSMLFISLKSQVYSQNNETMKIMETSKATSKTIVFIHGLFVNNQSWSEWEDYFKKKGYTCYAPANPFHAGNPETLRKDINSNLRMVTFEDVVNNIVKLIDSLPEKPIVIGHSLAGLVVQKLVALDKVAAGICIDGAPPKGIVTTKWSFWKVNGVVANPFKGNSVFKPTKKVVSLCFL